jgi:hypothetical protein
MLAKEYEMNEEIKYSSKAIPLRGHNDPKFKWISAANTDVRRTWRKARLLIRITKGAAYESRT